MKRLSALLFIAVLPLCMFAGPRLPKLDMTVQLCDNGDVRITEVRHMQIDLTGSEIYIVIGNLDDDSRVGNLQVRDEMGCDFRNIVRWDVDASRAAKARKCGIVAKSNGYELCWGQGETGDRTYTVRYVITNVVRSYQDADGFNFMFVASNISPHPEEVTITFEREDGEPLGQEDVKMWAFRYRGDINWVDGKVVARAEDGLEDDEAMIVMLRFEKGVLHPAVSVNEKFDTLKDKAFEDSSYVEGFFDDFSFFDILWLVLAFVFTPIVYAIWLVYVFFKRRKVMKDLMWYRDLPFNGGLLKTNQVMNAYRYFGKDYKGLISALVLRLLSIGALRIEEREVQPSAFKKMMGAQPKRMSLICIYPLIDDKKTKDMALLKKLHAIFLKASGDDAVLQPNELTQWMKSHTGEVDPFMNSLKLSRSVGDCDKDLENSRKVFGMKKFLEDFTLANERHVTELGLWKEYLIFAELFGIADQVRKDMKSINPEYLRMDQVLSQLSNENNTMLLTAYTLSGFRQYDTTKAAEAARSGGGGSASFGGGGGFSGGGSGGGVR